MSIKVKFMLGFLLCIVISVGAVSGISFWKMSDTNLTLYNQDASNQLRPGAFHIAFQSFPGFEAVRHNALPVSVPAAAADMQSPRRSASR